MRITVERSVDADVIEHYLPIYSASFVHLAEHSAAKQVLEDDEFRALLSSYRTLKFCGWSHSGRLIALALMTQDLSLVPWVSQPFFWRRWPEEIASDRLAYLLTILVEPEHRSEPWMARLVEALGAYSSFHHMTMIFDCCRYNIEEVPVPDMIAALANEVGMLETELIDIQHYYAYRMAGLTSAGLARLKGEGVIDLAAEEFQPRGMINGLDEHDHIDLREKAKERPQ